MGAGAIRVGLAADHAGFHLKDALAAHLRERGFAVTDLGVHSPESVDYPKLAEPLAEAVARGEYTFGVLCCGTGTGMSISANKVSGVRAALCASELAARLARGHNDANVLCLGERLQGVGLATAILDAFVDAPFEGGRHERRVEQIRQLDAKR